MGSLTRPVSLDLDRLTWTCHVCGLARPDCLISVFKHHHRSPSGVEMDENVRYCNDNPACLEGAQQHCFMGKPEEHVDA